MLWIVTIRGSSIRAGIRLSDFSLALTHRMNSRSVRAVAAFKRINNPKPILFQERMRCPMANRFIGLA
jgi:hypothetical protein